MAICGIQLKLTDDTVLSQQLNFVNILVIILFQLRFEQLGLGVIFECLLKQLLQRQDDAFFSQTQRFVLIQVSGEDQTGKRNKQQCNTATNVLIHGDHLPLEQLLQKAFEYHPKAKLLEAELEEDDDMYVYEVELLTQDGVVRELKLNAADGQLLKDEVDD